MNITKTETINLQSRSTMFSPQLIKLWVSINVGVLAIGMLYIGTILMLAQRGYGSLLIGIYSASYWVALLLTNFISQRIVRRQGMAWTYKLGSLIAFTGVTGFLLTDALPVWFMSQFLLGMSFSLHWIVGQTWVVSLAPGEFQGRIMSLDQLLGGALYALSPLVLAIIGLETKLAFGVAGALLVTTWAILLPLTSDALDKAAAAGGIRKNRSRL